MVRLTHESSHKVILPSDLNLWLAQYNRNHPNLADDCQRACLSLGVDWIKLFILAVVTTKWFSEVSPDVFRTGCTNPDIQAQIQEAATVWNSITDMAELKGFSQEDLVKFDKTLSLWRLRESFLIERRSGVVPDLPTGEPETPKQPSKPSIEPEAPPTEPAKPKMKLPKIPKLLIPFLSFSIGFLVGFLDKTLDKFIGPNEYDKWLRPLFDWLLSLLSN